MSEENVDVTTPDSSAGDNSGTAPVAAVPVMPTDRPEVNVLAEMNRKYSRLENQIGQVMTLLSNQIQQPANQYGQAKGDPTDDELWSLAQQGDRGAFQLLNRREARREAEQVQNERAREAIVEQQLNALAARYPVFNDTSHPLTQTVQSAYQIMVNRGYPAGKTTLLDAMKTAIADRPDLVADMVGRSPEAARISATRRAQAGQTGTTVRDSAPRSQQQISAAQAKMARNYGVKDPAKAMERFKQRQREGTSQFGQVGAYLDDSEIGGGLS